MREVVKSERRELSGSSEKEAREEVDKENKTPVFVLCIPVRAVRQHTREYTRGESAVILAL